MSDTLLVIAVVFAASGGLAFVARLTEKRSRRSSTPDIVAPIPEAAHKGDYAQYAVLQEHLRVEQQVKSGASWFYWIAGCHSSTRRWLRSAGDGGSSSAWPSRN